MLDRLLQEADPETYGPKSPAAPHSLSQSPPVKNSPLTPATTVAESPVAVPSNTQSPKQEVVRNTQNTSGEGMPIPADFTRDDEVDMAAADTAVDRWFKTLEAPQASNFAEFPHPRAFLNSLTPQHDPTSKKNAAGKGAVKKSVSKPAETRKKKGSIAAAAAPTGVSKKTRPHKSTSTRDPEWVNKVYGRR